MQSALRIVPAKQLKSASIKDTSNSLGLHDTLNYGPRTIAAELKSENDLKERLQNWEETQDNTKLTLQRNIYGLGVPLRLLMERKIVAVDNGLSPSNLHLDILMGRDELIEPADVFLGMESGRSQDIHLNMEKRRGV